MLRNRPICSPFDNRIVGEVPVSLPDDAEAAIEAAHAAFAQTRQLPSDARHAILHRIEKSIMDRREALAQGIVDEAGKTIRDARLEVDRAALVFSLAAEEARRRGGDVLPLDLNAASSGRLGLTRRFPVGPVAAITPFNFPLNLVAHKVAPAIAVGSPIVLKPAEKTPLTALRLQDIVRESGWPENAFHVLTPDTPQAVGRMLATDARLPVFSFTGSDKVGWSLKALANHKRVTLELGGNAAVIIEPDADIDYSVARCVIGSFANAGQVCISVQRVYVHESIFDDWAHQFVEAAAALRVGDPYDEETDVGPMIAPAACDRAEREIVEAIEGGATILLRGTRMTQNSLMSPTILTEVPSSMAACADEAFAPVVVVEPYHDFDDALARVNDSRFGLQAGVFTSNIGKIFRAWERLRVGGVIANDVPQYRVDNMPYGGEKDSGWGREGVRYAMEEMTEIRLLALNLRAGGGV